MTSLEQELTAFFDDFVAAFARFDGPLIAQRYVAPYLAMHADGRSAVFLQHAEIGAYFQRVVDDYRAQGCTACRYEALQAQPIGGRHALGMVTWRLLRGDGSVLSAWRESYNLVRSEGRWSIFASVDHAAA